MAWRGVADLPPGTVRRLLLRRPLLLGALLCAAGGGAARASQVGTIFSSPTTADPAVTYYNPGAMTLLQGTQALIFGGLSAIRLHHRRLTPSDFDGEVYPQADISILKPSITVGLVTDATLQDWRFGLGMSIPLMEGASWDREYGGKPASTRYYVMDGLLVYFKFGPTVAYRINRFLSVGVGLDVEAVMLRHEAMTDFGAKIDQLACAGLGGTDCPVNAPLARENPAFDGLTSLSGLGWDLGLSAGVLLTPRPWLRASLGLHSGAGAVRVPVQMKIAIPRAAADYVASNLPSFSLPELTADADVQVHSPMTLAAGLSLEPTPRLRLAADLHWMDLSETALMMATVTRASTGLIGDQVLVKDRLDDFLVGLFGSYRVLPALDTALRLEYGTNSRPDPYVSPVSIDFHKISFHLGLSWRALRWLELTAEYGHYFLLSRHIAAGTSRFAPNANPQGPVQEGLDKPSPEGDYWVESDRFALGLLLHFGG